MKMEWLRTALIASIALICFLLVIRWNDFQERNQVIDSPPATVDAGQPSTLNQANNVPDAPSLPKAANEGEDNVPGQQPKPGVQTDKVHVRTDVLDVTIDTKGGDIVRVALPTFYEELNEPDEPFVLLNQAGNHTYVARSGLVGEDGTDSNQSRPQFNVAKSEYILDENDGPLNVDLTYRQDTGVLITKRFTFTPGSHLIDVTYIVDNQSQEPWQATMYGQIKRDAYNPVKTAGLGMQPFLGAATTTIEDNYLKLDFDDIAEESLEHKKEGGWVAMVQHYFLSAWIPPEEDINSYQIFKLKNSDMYFLQFTGQPFNAAPGETTTETAGFYAGPKDIRTLEQISPYLDLTVDYSFLWWIAKPLFYALDAIHSVVGNWGVAIILLTICIKLIFFYPSAVSYRSMAKMRKIQPKMAELKERYGDDRQKFSGEMMKLYRQEKVNPLSGCLPILIQMPVFLALYWVLMESVELRQAPFFWWIQDLSAKDPFYILPLIMGATMWIQQKLNPTPPDPMQAKVMQMMPVFFTFLFLFFPAGLVLYWVVNQTLSVTQQYVITKQIEKQK